jgi:hypothetical protein
VVLAFGRGRGGWEAAPVSELSGGSFDAKKLQKQPIMKNAKIPQNR